MAVTYTTAALVKKRVKNISAGLINTDIEENIYEAESMIDTSIKNSFLATFDEAKHRIIRQCATDLAAFLCVIYDTTAFLCLADAEFTVNLLWNSAERSLSILDDPRKVDYLLGL